MMGPPPPFLMGGPLGAPFGHVHDDDIFDEIEEDPFEVIDRMEREMKESRRNAGIGGSIGGMFGMGAPRMGTPTINTKPDLHPALAQDVESGVPHFDEPVKHEHHPYNDSSQHSSLYMFTAIVTVVAVGVALWYFFIKEAMQQGTVRSKGGQQQEPREISLSRFNKNV